MSNSNGTVPQREADSTMGKQSLTTPYTTKGGVALLSAPGRNDRDETYSPTATNSSLSLRLLTEACFRHPWQIPGVVVATLLVTILVILLMPPRYQATMQLLVLNARENSVISSGSEGFTRPMSEVTDADVNSQAELLRSRDVLSGALDQLGRSQTPELERDKAVEALGKNLDISPVRQSNVLNVSYIDASPAVAKLTLQALASSFVGKELELRRPPQSKEFFLQLVASNRHELSAAEQTLADFKVSTGIASLTESEATLLRQLEGSTTQSAELTAALAEEQRRTQRTRDELRLHPDRITTQSRSTPNQRAVEDLATKLVDLQNKRIALLTGYQPTERNVQEVALQIAAVQEEITKQRQSNAIELTTDNNPLTQDLKSQLAKNEIASASLTARRLAVDTQKTDYRGQLDQLEENTAKYQDLQKSVVEAQHNVDLAKQKRDQADFEDALDRERILNVAFAAKPSSSHIPVQPRPRLYLALGLFTGVFLAVGFCAVSEMTRNTIYTAAELEQLTGVMTLASIPTFRHLTDTFASSSTKGGEGVETDVKTGYKQIDLHAAVVRSVNL